METKSKPKTDAEKLAALEESFASRLPNAVMGEVCTRFPPEPSGYLHIGHAKAALINAFYARYFKGKVLIRFDDTNPSKEKAEFEESILEDLKLLNVHGEGPSYTSDYFPQLQTAMEQLIRDEKAYCDDTPTEQMRFERGKGIESKCRSNSVEENLRRWNEMLSGSEEGIKNCVRAKIDMQNNNKCLRDPVMYRCNIETPHHRHGTTYKAYPCYDFACPLVDSWSGVTHALRTNEYADRIPQYYWVQEACKVRPTTIYEFSRLNFTNTVLSKRRLQWLVDTGVVAGWDDPRFPTVRGMIRRGLQVQALHEFLIEQGPSKNVNIMEWDKLWAKNQKILDPISKRFMAVAANAVPICFRGISAPGISKMRPLHPKNPAIGEIELLVTPEVLIEHEDAQLCEVGEEITLMRFGNVILEKAERNEENVVVRWHAVTHVDGDVKSTKKKLHWIPKCSEQPYKFALREFDHIITKKKPEEGDSMEDIVNRNSMFDTVCLGEPGLVDLKEGEIVQLERRGYVRVDSQPDSERGNIPVFILIPSGKMKSMSTLSTKVDNASLARGGKIAK